jgi:hypothetical protein
MFLCQFYTNLPYTRAVVMPPYNSRYSTTDRRPRAPVRVATYLVVMTHSLSLETATGKLLCCVCEDKIYVCCLGYTLVRSVYGNNYFQNYDLKDN